MSTVTTFFKSNTRYSKVSTTYLMISGNQSLWNFKLDSKNDFGCNKTYPIIDVLELTKTWQVETTNVSCKPFAVSFIFSHTLSSAEEYLILQSKLEEQRRNEDFQRFFITQSSNSSIDFIYSSTTFQDFNIDDIFPQICDMVHDDLSFTLSDANYFDSVYYLSKHLSNITYDEAECSCNTRHGSILFTFETIYQASKLTEKFRNISATNNLTEINAFLEKDVGESLVWFDAKLALSKTKNECLYFNGFRKISLATKIFKGTEEFVSSFEPTIKSTDCAKHLQDTLVVCKYVPNRIFQKTPIVQQHKTTRSIHVLNIKSFGDFLKTIFSNMYDIRLTSGLDIMGYTCNLNEILHKDLQNYLCSNDMLKNVGSMHSENKNNIVTIISKENDMFYKIKSFEISQCEKYNECNTDSEEEFLINSSDITINCLDKGNVEGNCSSHNLNFNLSLEYSHCQSNVSQQFYKCIKYSKTHCHNQFNLHNCENFICPEPFVKCPNSYCIFPFMLNDGISDCPLGEDENWDSFQISKELWLMFIFKDACLDSSSYAYLYGTNKYKTFICNNVCPHNYKCISRLSVIKLLNYLENTYETAMGVNFYSILLPLKEIDDVYFPFYHFDTFFPMIFFIQFNCRGCRFKNFDREFYYWDFEELLILDLSMNELSHSNQFRSIESFSKLKIFNISGNELLIIDENFTFPKSLEILDLSYTQVSKLRKNVFSALQFLWHLNLSYTLITKFKSTGLPEKFKLATFYFQGISSEYVEKDFFRGLTIESELRASDYVICCPQILNTNISAEKCHAPIDVISSCKHLVGDTLKRVVFWIVGLLTILGNGTVLVYRIVWDRDIFKKPYGLFISGLAVSDFIMGVYLIIIAIVDVYYTDVYVLEDFRWRNGILCYFLGILSTLSCETSTFFICLIAVDRYLCITYPFGEHRFSKTGKLLSFTLVWLFSFIIALIPVVLSDWDIYSSNGLCLALPFSSRKSKGWLFSFLLYVVLNFILFSLIAIGQVKIFTNFIEIKKSIADVRKSDQRGSVEFKLAKKLAFVALTDFCCWFPVGILGFLSLGGHVFDREVYAWIAVLVLPINSALNPIIYTIPAVYDKFKNSARKRDS